MPRHPDPCVSVIVVAARDPARLGGCLEAVGASTGVATELVVVLNAAAPDVERAAAAAGANIVRSSVPLGFAGGANRGAAAARGRYLHVLHDDAVVEPGAIAALVAALEATPRAGAAGSLLLDAGDGAPQSAGHVLWRDGRTAPPWRGEPPPAETWTEVRSVDYCSSASLMVRADAWRAVGGFDEELHPAQFVDVDLAMRLRSRGLLVVVAPASRVRHARGGSASAAVRRVAWERNRARFVATWADDLRWQEPFADDADALERAAEATRRRTDAVLAGPADLAPATVPADPDPERSALLRDLAFKDACVAELRRLDARVAELEAELAALHPELHRVHTAHAAEMAARIAASEDRDRHAARATAQDDELGYLRQRAGVLDGILAGRWWRLRERLRRGGASG